MKTGTSRLPARAQTGRGFSILELLTSLAILAMLVALLIPAVDHARQAGRQTVCASNMRELYMASQTFIGNNAGLMTLTPTSWTGSIEPCINNSAKVLICPSSSDASDGGTGNSGHVGSAGKKLPMPGTIAYQNWPRGTAPGQTFDAGQQASTGPGNGVMAPVFYNDPNLSNIAVYVVTTGFYIPCVPGQWARLKDVTANSYTLSMEDQGGQGGGDFSFENVCVTFTSDNGYIDITESPGWGAYRSNLVNSATGATIFENIGGDQGLVNSGKLLLKVKMSGSGVPGPTYILPGSGGSMSMGPSTPTAGGSSDGSSGSTTAQTSTILTNYAMNEYVQSTFGRSDKVFLIDYVSDQIAVDVDAGGDNWADAFWNYNNGMGPLRFARHSLQANICFGDGSVRLSPVNPSSFNPGLSNVRAQSWMN